MKSTAKKQVVFNSFEQISLKKIHYTRKSKILKGKYNVYHEFWCPRRANASDDKSSKKITTMRTALQLGDVWKRRITL
jgi:hypothetical protein